MRKNAAAEAAAERLLNRIREGENLSASELYEIQQQGSTLVARFVSRGQDADAVQLCEKLARGLVSQPAMAASFCTQLAGILEEFELAATPSRVSQVASLAEDLPYAPGGGTRDFLAAALVWARKVDAPRHWVQQLRATAARVFTKAGEFGAAQGAALELNDCDAVATVLREWRDSPQLYESERHMVALRAILLLLANEKCDLALQTIQSSVLEYNLDSPVLPLPIQLAYLLAVACKTKNQKFFDFCCKRKYGLVVYRDPTLEKLVKQIEMRVFNQAPSNLFEGLFAAAASVQQQHVRS